MDFRANDKKQVMYLYKKAEAAEKLCHVFLSYSAYFMGSRQVRKAGREHSDQTNFVLTLADTADQLQL